MMKEQFNQTIESEKKEDQKNQEESEQKKVTFSEDEVKKSKEELAQIVTESEQEDDEKADELREKMGLTKIESGEFLETKFENEGVGSLEDFIVFENLLNEIKEINNTEKKEENEEKLRLRSLEIRKILNEKFQLLLAQYEKMELNDTEKKQVIKTGRKYMDYLNNYFIYDDEYVEKQGQAMASLSNLATDGVFVFDSDDWIEYKTLKGRKDYLTIDEAHKLRFYTQKETKMNLIFNDLTENNYDLNYKSFNPIIELKKIGYFTDEEKEKYSLEERLKIKKNRLNEYKKELVNQKKGILNIQVGLEEQIRKNPDMSSKDLMQTVLSQAEDSKLSNFQLDAFKDGILKYTETHQIIKDYRKKYPKDEDFFEALFAIKPKGKIEIDVNLITIFVKCRNLEDYARLYKGIYLAKITDEDMKQADLSGGFFDASYIRLPELRNSITVQKDTQDNVLLEYRDAMSQEEWQKYVDSGMKEVDDLYLDYKIKQDEAVSLHEEQHALNALISNFKDQFFYHNIKQNELYGENKDKEESLKRILRIDRNDKEIRAKDEILAYLKAGRDIAEIQSILFKKNGLYDYYSGEEHKNLEQFLKSELEGINLKNFNDVYEKSVNEAQDDYRKNIENSLKAVKYLEVFKKKSREEIIHFLINEPLDKWNKTLQRLK